MIGGSTTTTAIDASKGERSYAGIVFLEPSTINQENVRVRSNVLVERIVFDNKVLGGNLVATGIVYSQEGRECVTVFARREVIICAGTYGSPKLLELSGFGRRDRLAAAGIKCLRELSGVGENLQDHLNFGPSVEVLDSIDTMDIAARDPVVAEAEQRLYDTKHKGPLAERAAYSFTYLPLQASNSEQEEHELEKIVEKALRDSLPTASRGLQAQYGIIRRMIYDPEEATSTVFMVCKQSYTQPSEPMPGNNMSIIAMLSYPFSRGTSHISNSVAKTNPEIRFNYLQHPLDAEILARHVLHISKTLDLPALSALLKHGGNTLPAGYSRQIAAAEDVKVFLHQFAATNYHPVGTCAMMREGLDGVVDENLRVYGTADVRICDASVIPILPRRNILSTVYTVAEKAADLIEEDLKA